MLNPFRKSYNAEELDIFRFLQKATLFSELTQDELYNFLPYLYLRQYKENEVVFFRNDPSQALYIIQKGQISLSITLSDKTEYLTSVSTHQTLGDNSLIPNAKRIYNAIVTSEVAEMYVLPQANLLAVFERDARIKAKMYAALSTSYNQYMVNLFKAYQSSFGFFDLSTAYK
ncbi:Cyclic nucleotide-binding domain-containing protein [Flexibacter flexilis DSM 6793]|uniref:Cyclic nucleotide-binding domain-containing protein n=1 Tax=Flexibacter flexilis DSM 6793 TaxID=927664 RepID=A0A1I1HUR0_9BACT|nr:cyclic nucleotide-binding domain-containing protein [Flexibacter flexilis]SFC27302.1 Cyclic nucleotide-binding domain-containing protein [Flexibacter flexilis DSM 6793]